jgi:hypothetical protein
MRGRSPVRSDWLNEFASAGANVSTCWSWTTAFSPTLVSPDVRLSKRPAVVLEMIDGAREIQIQLRERRQMTGAIRRFGSHQSDFPYFME